MVTDNIHAERTVSEKILEGLEPYYGVQRVFGTPIEKDGMTVLPVARIRGGGGGGGGGGSSEEAGTGSGEGGGFGISSEPAGVYVITSDGVEWQPALDQNKIVVGSTLVSIALFFFGYLALRSRARES